MQIYSIWVAWFLTTIFNVIILMNFLIAFISETYEQVYSREKVDEFSTMAKLNQDYRLMTRQYALLRTIKF